MGETIIEFLVNGAVILVIVGIFAYSIWWRRNQLKKFAEAQGLQYDVPEHKQRVQQLLDTRDDIPLFSGENSKRKCKHALSATIGDAFFTVCEISFEFLARRSSKSSTYDSYTVALIISETSDFPSMHLEPEGWGWKITTKLMGFQDIDFEDHTPFSKKYVLQGPDEDAIRAFLDKDKLDALTAQPAYFIDASKDILLLYYKKSGHKPKKLKQLAESANEIFKIMSASA